MADDLTPGTPDEAAGRGSTGKRAKADKPPKRRGPSRPTVLLVGIVIGAVGVLVAPLLLPEKELTCTMPTSFEWSNDGGGVTTTVGADSSVPRDQLCTVDLVFDEP